MIYELVDWCCVRVDEIETHMQAGKEERKARASFEGRHILIQQAHAPY